MTQLQTDYARRMAQLDEWHRQKLAAMEAANDRLLWKVLGLIFVWAVVLTGLLGWVNGWAS